MIAEQKVLDHGFIKLLDVMGDDAEVARAARVSYGKYDEVRDWDKDAKLTKYLKDHNHTSPFEMIELKWQVKCPIFVARQWMRHRTFNYNEISYRYTEAEDEYYNPTEWRGTDVSNKQSSSGNIYVGNVQRATFDYNAAVAVSMDTYRELLALGVAREQARMVLPLSTYTEFVAKNDLKNTLHFITLREHEGAQWEIQEYARAMKSMIQQALPLLGSILFD